MLYVMCLVVLLFQCSSSSIIYATEVHSVKTEGSIGFSGSYEPKGIPDPAPYSGTKQDYSIEIASSPTAISNGHNLPKTNTAEDNRGFFLGVLLLIIIGFILKKKKEDDRK